MLMNLLYRHRSIYHVTDSLYYRDNLYGSDAGAAEAISAESLQDNDGVLLQDNDGTQLEDN